VSREVADQPAAARAPASGDAGPLERLRRALQRSLIGKERVVEDVLACLLARGHLLLEDLPGTGKTTLAKALAAAVGGRFARIQGTPDLLPGDVTGFNMFDPRTREFVFQPGPVFADVLLADEINRATPRAQSALFEAMSERQVTLDGRSHPLSEGFFVIATQNSAESHGAYPLPDGQLDRFAMKLTVGYPSPVSEAAMLEADVGRRLPRPGEAVVSREELGVLQEEAARVSVDARLRGYLVALARRTREHPRVEVGVSPRGLLTWQRVAQARANLGGRDFVTPDDLQEVAAAVLGCRLTVDADAEEAGRAAAEAIVAEVLADVTVPV